MTKINNLLKTWGIDIEGRKMWYEPWPIDDSGKYRKPKEKEIKEIYGISGEAVEETTDHFIKCGGCIEDLVELLNSHVIDKRFLISSDELLDRQRWYNNEYYFYFIMFTKKIIGRYDFHFGENNDELLSFYHRPYEKGYLEFIPIGKAENNKKVKEQSGAYVMGGYYFTYSVLNETRKKIFIKEIINFINFIFCQKTKIKLDINFLQKEFNWYSIEAFYYIWCLYMIYSNCNNLIHVAAQFYFNNLPTGIVSFLTKAAATLPFEKYFHKIVNVANNISIIDVVRKAKNHFFFSVAFTKEFKNRYRVYKYIKFHIVQYETAYAGAFEFIPMIAFRLKKKAKINFIKKMQDIDDYFKIEILWEPKRFQEKRIFYYPLFLLPLLPLYFLEHSFIILFILFFIMTCFYIFLISHYKSELKEKLDIIAQSLEDFQLARSTYEEYADELRNEKEVLEETVVERTKALQEANQKLKELDKAKTNFLTNISHELRTPLSLIKAPVEAILDKRYGNSIKNTNPIFYRINRQTDKLIKLINNLLNFSKIELGKATPILKKVNLVKLLKTYCTEFDSAASAKHLKLTYKNNISQEVFILIDIDLFESAIFNLISNAIKFTPQNGMIDVILDTFCISEEFIITVKDTGIGIPKDKLTTIFNRFEQVESNSNRKYEGAGIGLSLVKEIINLHQGRIEVESELGQGSIFKIFLPIFHKKEIIELEEIKYPEYKQKITWDDNFHVNKNVNPNSSSSTILIVEDNKDMIEHLKFLLENKYNLFFAGNGREALGMLTNINTPDLIIADIMMPVMDGKTFRQKILQNPLLKYIPFIFLTARATLEEKIEGLQAGAIDYIMKPFSNKEVEAKIDTILKINKNQFESLVQDMEKSIYIIRNRKINFNNYDTIEKKCKRYLLSKREREVIYLLIKGKMDKEIADELGIAARTVSNHVSRIFEKTGAGNRTELLRYLGD